MPYKCCNSRMPRKLRRYGRTYSQWRRYGWARWGRCPPPPLTRLVAHPVLPRFVPAHIRHNSRNIQTDSGVPNLHDNWMVEVLTSAVAAAKCQPKRFRPNRCCRMLYAPWPPTMFAPGITHVPWNPKSTCLGGHDTQHVAVLGLVNSTEGQRCMQGYAYLRNLSDQIPAWCLTSPNKLRMSRASRCKRPSVTRYSSRRTTKQLKGSVHIPGKCPKTKFWISQKNNFNTNLHLATAIFDRFS
jgi:hypothetical protein